MTPPNYPHQPGPYGGRPAPYGPPPSGGQRFGPPPGGAPNGGPPRGPYGPPPQGAPSGPPPGGFRPDPYAQPPGHQLYDDRPIVTTESPFGPNPDNDPIPKRRVGRKIITSLVVLALLVGGGIGAYIYYKKQTKD